MQHPPDIKEVAAIVIEHKNVSPGFLQRKFKISYNEAAKLIDELEEKGIVGPFQGSRPREVLMDKIEKL